MDTVSDFLTRLRNAVSAGHDKVDLPSSSIKKNIADVLKRTGYVSDYKIVKDDKQGVMRVYLASDDKGRAKINVLKKVSRPSRRVYINVDKIPSVRSGFGIAVLSTNKGILSGQEAKSQNLGGELLCLVW